MCYDGPALMKDLNVRLFPAIPVNFPDFGNVFIRRIMPDLVQVIEEGFFRSM